ncbi:MAG: hypothetical protein WD271_11815 [Acidimicrobiia bacterium]
MRRWLWALGGLIAVLVVVLVVVFVTRDDGSDSASSTTTTTTSSATTTTSPTTTTSTAAPATTSTLPLPPVTDDPQSYAEYLFVTWRNGNKTAAANVASSDAVSQIFAQSYQATSGWTFQMCDPAAGSLYCTWTGTNNTKLLMTVRTLTGGLPIQVVMVQFQTP